MNVRPGDIISLEAFVPCWTFWKEHLRREDTWHFPREIRKDIVFSLLNEWSIQEVYSGIPIFHIGRIVWNHGYPRHALCLVHVCSVLVVFNLWLCSCHECFRSSGGKQNPTTWPQLCGEKRIARSITACDWGVQISTACFEVSWHPCFFFGLGLIQSVSRFWLKGCCWMWTHCFS